MIKRTILTSVVVIIFISCKKQTTTPVDYKLAGKWLYKENGLSIGGPIVWSNATPAGQVVEFKTDGTFKPASNFLTGTNRYEKLDSVTIKFTPASNPNGYVKMGYNIDSLKGKLTLWPVEPMCIEGCGYRFEK